MHFQVKNLRITSKNGQQSSKKLKAKFEWFRSGLKCRKIGAGDAITTYTSKNSRNNVSKRKQTTNKVLHNIFRGLELRAEVPLMFQRPKSSMKSRSYVFSGYQQRNQVCFVYLDCKR